MATAQDFSIQLLILFSLAKAKNFSHTFFMNKTAHSIYLASLTAIVIVVTVYLFYYGGSYYNTSMEERFTTLTTKPSSPVASMVMAWAL